MTTVKYCRECHEHTGKSTMCLRTGQTRNGYERACPFFSWKQIPRNNPPVQSSWLRMPTFLRTWML
jgi:hypothetical protein